MLIRSEQRKKQKYNIQHSALKIEKGRNIFEKSKSTSLNFVVVPFQDLQLYDLKLSLKARI